MNSSDPNWQAIHGLDVELPQQPTTGNKILRNEDQSGIVSEDDTTNHLNDKSQLQGGYTDGTYTTSEEEGGTIDAQTGHFGSGTGSSS